MVLDTLPPDTQRWIIVPKVCDSQTDNCIDGTQWRKLIMKRCGDTYRYHQHFSVLARSRLLIAGCADPWLLRKEQGRKPRPHLSVHSSSSLGGHARLCTSDLHSFYRRLFIRATTFYLTMIINFFEERSRFLCFGVAKIAAPLDLWPRIVHLSWSQDHV